jgi:hypothetical protein
VEEELMTTDELFELLIGLRRLSDDPPEHARYRGLDMPWPSLEAELSRRGECAAEGCSSFAVALEYEHDGGSGAPARPRPTCAAHADEPRTMTVWDGGWDWLRRSSWDGLEPLP